MKGQYYKGSFIKLLSNGAYEIDGMNSVKFYITLKGARIAAAHKQNRQCKRDYAGETSHANY